MGSGRIYSRRDKTEPFVGYGGAIVRFPLDTEAATRWASRTLPSEFLRVLDLSLGKWDAALPEQTPIEVANDFERGVLPESDVSRWQPFNPAEYGPQMSETIATSLGCAISELVVVPKASLVLIAAKSAIDYLNDVPSGVALIREMNRRIQPERTTWSTAMGTFYPVAASDFERDALADVMDLAADASSEFMLLSTTGELDPGASMALGDQALTGLVSRANGLFLGAYDGEGYIRWRRTRPV